MREILMSIKAKHNRNIESGLKTSELRKRPPKCKYPIKVYTYESGFDGRRKVVNEWICRNATEWRICMGVPAHLAKRACLSVGEIIEYSGKNYDNITEMEISDLKIYDKPREITEFALYGKCAEDCDEYDICARDSEEGRMSCKFFKRTFLKRPPQSWCYVEEEECQ